jgi:hypothetical protein
VAAQYTNRLIHETSPYLLQHAHNPVDWQPWDTEALERAQREDKPILLSIGYSACHWCHVMEHESFEDETVARVMNERFVCIKVDREERPDLDKIYQTAHQILTRRPGGWPLNMFLTPGDHMPFFGGTYFPKSPRHGLPGFVDILERVAEFYRGQRAAVDEQNTQLRDIFVRLAPAGAAGGVNVQEEVLTRAVTELEQQYDRRHGGFGGAPKFPHPTSLELLLRGWARERLQGRENRALHDIVRHTLRAMALGGIYDQVGGGFCRYAVDEQWMIPHFEKMLYDNGQLLALYADGWAATGHTLFRHTAITTAEWVMREMQSPQGGYYSSLDADSEGHEGKHYVWDAKEIKDLLAPEEWELVEARYGLKGTPNFEGCWHLHARLDNHALADRFQHYETEIEERIESAHRKLYTAREQRVRPGCDDKSLASWNALMIKGMARAAWRLHRADLLASAQRAFDFVRRELWKDGRLLATYRGLQVPREAGSRERPTAKDGKAHLNAYLDDYVFLMDAGLELLQAQWRTQDLELVRALAEVVLARFEDKERGGFFFTADDHERLVYRPKPVSDDAIPSGNGVAAQVFLRLGHLLGDLTYLRAAERTVEALYGAVAEYPSAHASLAIAIEEYLHPTQTVVIRGGAEDTHAWLERARLGYAPWRAAYAIPPDEKLPGVLAVRAPCATVTAYVCTGPQCSAPVTALADFAETLGA